SACIDESIGLLNTSVNAISYQWDFCNDGLGNGFEASPSGLEIAGINQPQELEIKYDKGIWYGFVTSRLTNELVRLDFGDSLFSNPVLTNMGNIDGRLNLPNALKLVYQGDMWYGFLINSGNGSLIRLNFGGSLSNVPSTENLGNLDGWSDPRMLDYVTYLDQHYIIVTSAGNDKITVIDFGNSVNNSVGTIKTLVNPGGVIDIPVGISVLPMNGNWYGLVGTSTNKLYHFDFGSSLFNDPIISEISDLNQPKELILVEDGGSFFGFIVAPKNLYRIQFENDLTFTGSEVVEDLGNPFGLFDNLFGAALVVDGADWKLGLLNQNSNNMALLAFRDSCEYVNISTSDEIEPTISFTQSGVFSISLVGESSNLNRERISKEISITPSTAPDISFSISTNRCVSNPNTFTS
ncbi:unnamed protein product, partial [Chrysoparadoxa australica]